MEKTAAGGQTAAHGLFVSRKRQEQHGGELRAQCGKLGFHLFPLGIGEGESVGSRVHRHILHQEDQPAAALVQLCVERSAGQFIEVLRSHGQRHAKENPLFSKCLHPAGDGLVNPRAAPRVRLLCASLQAKNRQEVAAAVEQREGLPVDQRAVCEDREKRIGMPGGFLQHAPPQERFAAGQQVDAHSSRCRTGCRSW